MDILAESFFDISVRFRALIKNGHLERIHDCKKVVITYIRNNIKNLIVEDDELLDILICLYGIKLAKTVKSQSDNFSLFQRLRELKISEKVLQDDKLAHESINNNLTELENIVSCIYDNKEIHERIIINMENISKALKFLFDISLKYKVFVSHIDSCLNLSKDDFNKKNIENFVNKSACYVHHLEEDSTAEYIKILYPYDIYEKFMGEKFHESSNYTMEILADLHSIHGFVLDLSHQHFSINAAVKNIRNTLETLVFMRQIMQDDDITILNKKHYGTKNKKSLLNVFSMAVLWDEVNLNKKTQGKAAKSLCQLQPYSICCKNKTTQKICDGCRQEISRNLRAISTVINKTADALK